MQIGHWARLYFRQRLPHFVGQMIRIGLVFGAVLWFAVFPIRAATNDPPDLQEVLGLLRTHLSGATDSDLNRLAVEGLLSNLHGKVTLMGGSPATSQTNRPPLAKASVVEGNVAFLRLAAFDATLAGQITSTLAQFTQTNKLIGLVLDLRFAEGDDYAVAASVADLFQAKPRLLMDWGGGSAASKEKPDPIKLPVAVLVNRETAGAAEALAAVLRETSVALLIGGTTEGSALIAEEFTLKNGQRLRIATTPIKVADGLALTTQGVKPDIEVAASLEEDRAWLDDPYAAGKPPTLAVAAPGSTNQPASAARSTRRPRTSEADLVRARREGVSLDGELPEPRNAEPSRPVIRDATLARAVDLLKGLAVIRATRS